MSNKLQWVKQILKRVFIKLVAELGINLDDPDTNNITYTKQKKKEKQTHNSNIGDRNHQFFRPYQETHENVEEMTSN